MKTPSPTKIKGMFDGPILPVTLKIGTPILIGSLVQLLYAMIDTYFISRIDPSSTALLSGTGLMFPIFFFFMALGQSLSVGISSLTGRMIGENRSEETRFIMESGLLISWIVAIPALGLGYLYSHELIDLLAGNKIGAEAHQVGFLFFRSLLPGLGLMLFSPVFMGLLQGEGKTGTIAKAMITSTLSNIILDPIFIFGFGWGVSGAGIATSLSILISALYILSAFLRGKSSVRLALNCFEAKSGIVLEILKTALPNFISMAALNISFIILNKIVSSISETHMNAWSLVARMDQVMLIPAFAIAGATITMISQNYGKNQMDRVFQIYKTNILFGISVVGCISFGYMLSAPFFFRLFSSLREVIDLAVHQVHFLAFTFTGICAAIVSTASFQATGRPAPALVITLVRMGLIAIPTSFLLTWTLHMGIQGVWTGLGLGNLLCLPLAILWTSRHLKNLEFRPVINSEEEENISQNPLM